MSELEEFRQRKDEFFRTGDESPLPADERESFAGLKYFPENPALSFLVSLARTPEEELEFETSSGEKKRFKRIGKLGFSVEGQPAQLTLYFHEREIATERKRGQHQAESGSYFLPFRDLTSGQETYGAGRYLEVEEKPRRPDGVGAPTEASVFELDFNYAYNPYCAYAPNYSCPLPPLENWLKVPIEAGEKKFHE